MRFAIALSLILAATAVGSAVKGRAGKKAVAQEPLRAGAGGIRSRRQDKELGGRTARGLQKTRKNLDCVLYSVYSTLCCCGRPARSRG